MRQDERIKKWHLRFLQMAKLVSEWSKDPSTKCGAVITDYRHRVISVGFNGMPQSISVGEEMDYLKDREIKYQVILHAEENAILMAAGHSLEGATLYTTGHCCAKCTSIALQVGIQTFVSYTRPELESRETWADNMHLARTLQLTALHYYLHPSFPDQCEIYRYEYEEVFGKAE